MSTLGKATRTPPKKCPLCGGGPLDAASGVDGDHVPKAGDYTVCIYCAGVLIFTGNLTVRAPNYRELLKAQLGENWPLIQRARQAVLRLREDVDYTKKRKSPT